METRIPYKPKTLFLLATVICFGLCAFASGYMALQGKNGASLFNLITLEPGQPVTLYIVLFGVSLVCATVAGIFFCLTLTQKREIIFTDHELQFPHLGLNKDYIHIPYHDIVQTSEVQVNSTNIFNVDHQRGEISLHSSMVPDKQYYEQFKLEICHRVYGHENQQRPGM